VFCLSFQRQNSGGFQLRHIRSLWSPLFFLVPLPEFVLLVGAFSFSPAPFDGSLPIIARKNSAPWQSCINIFS
jgi:hypothetical protein